MSFVSLEDLMIESNNKRRGVNYQPTRAIPLRKLFNALMIPKGRIFVDFGCGKGRVLMIASEFGFKELRGIEFSPELCKIARNNCAMYKQKTGVGAKFDIIESDATAYSINDDEDVFFLFQPFDGVILNEVLKNIIASLTEKPRKIFIIYLNPVHGDIIENQGLCVKLGDFMFWGHKFTVYSNTVFSGLSKNL